MSRLELRGVWLADGRQSCEHRERLDAPLRIEVFVEDVEPETVPGGFNVGVTLVLRLVDEDQRVFVRVAGRFRAIYEGTIPDAAGQQKVATKDAVAAVWTVWRPWLDHSMVAMNLTPTWSLPLTVPAEILKDARRICRPDHSAPAG